RASSTWRPCPASSAWACSCCCAATALPRKWTTRGSRRSCRGWTAAPRNAWTSWSPPRSTAAARTTSPWSSSGACRLPRMEPASHPNELLVPVSFGELLDKIAILQIKSERMTDKAKLANVRNELSALERTWMAHPAASNDITRLRAEHNAVNECLREIEDEVRLKEKAGDFDDEFIRLARSVYFQNDERARLKKEINLALGSAYVEEKSYQDYRGGAAAP